MIKLSKVYLNASDVGSFINEYNRICCIFNTCDSTDDWSASEECATLAEAVINKHKEPMKVLNKIRKGKYPICDHGWDDYTRGFIAGQCCLTIEEMQKAEQIWEDDRHGAYGYYQEVCDEILENR